MKLKTHIFYDSIPDPRWTVYSSGKVVSTHKGVKPGFAQVEKKKSTDMIIVGGPTKANSIQHSLLLI